MTDTAVAGLEVLRMKRDPLAAETLNPEMIADNDQPIRHRRIEERSLRTSALTHVLRDLRL
jgi:hypothetical protein